MTRGSELQAWMSSLRAQFYDRCAETLGVGFAPTALFTTSFGEDANVAAKRCAEIAADVFGVDMLDHYSRQDDWADWVPIPDSMFADRYKSAQQLYQTARRRLLEG